MKQRHRKSRDEHLSELRAKCDALKDLDDHAFIRAVKSASADELPALSTLWLYYDMLDEDRKRAAKECLKRLVERGLKLGYFNLIRVMADDHVDGSSTNYDARHLIEETIAEIGWAIAKRPSTRRVTSWVTFCPTKLKDAIKRLDRHEALGDTNGRIAAATQDGRDLTEEASASIDTGGTFVDVEENAEVENLKDHLRGVIRRTGDEVMMAVAEDQFFSGDPSRITGPPDQKGRKSLVELLPYSKDQIDRAKKNAWTLIKAVISKEYGLEMAKQFTKQTSKPKAKKQHAKHSKN